MDRDFGIRFKYRSFFERSLIRYLKQREFIVLSAILSRTLSFGKFAEEIPISQFVNGIRCPSNGELIRDEEGNPWFEGTGMDKNTIRAAVDDLSKVGLITVYSIPNKGTKDVYAFSWMSLRNMYAAAIEIDPENAPRIQEALANVPLSKMAIFRDPVHKLEERCGRLFPDGLAGLEAIKAHNTERLEAAQRKYLGL